MSDCMKEQKMKMQDVPSWKTLDSISQLFMYILRILNFLRTLFIHWTLPYLLKVIWQLNTNLIQKIK